MEAPMPDSAAIIEYRKRKARDRLIVILAVMLALIAMAALSVGRRIMTNGDSEVNPIVAGRLSQQEISDNLQNQVDAGMFNCEINPDPTFKTADSTGLLAIRNAPANSKGMCVTITLDDTGETVYTGEILQPGEQKLEDKLSMQLTPGTYPATASIEVLDPSTKDTVANLKMALAITIMQ
ncbi:MAG: hypothetical protein RR829_04450 [Oscillospiraceae bacterium]